MCLGVSWTFTNIDVVSLVGSFLGFAGTLIVAIVLYQFQKRSAIEQARFTQALSDASAKRQTEFAHELAHQENIRQSAIEAILSLNLHVQDFIHGFEECHPQGHPPGQSVAVDDDMIRRLQRTIGDLNNDKLRLGLLFGDVVALRSAIDLLIEDARFVVDSSVAPLRRPLDEYYERQIAQDRIINAEMGRLWDAVIAGRPRISN